MKTNRFSMAACISLLLLSLLSCSREKLSITGGGEEANGGTVMLSIEKNGNGRGIPYGTRASGSEHGDQNKDNTVSKLEVFIFRNAPGKADDGKLENYKCFSGDELGTLENLEIRTSSGKKTVVAIANSHRDDWRGITDLNSLKESAFSLKNENTGDFTMSGSTEATISGTTDVSIALSRMVARIKLSGISADFSGTPYEDVPLTGIKAYLINVCGNSYLSGTTSYAAGNYLNHGGYNAGNCSEMAMEGIMYEEISGQVTSGSPFTEDIFFYCYENTVPSENGTDRFTRLVVEASIGGTTYYYPVNINRSGFGYSSGLEGISRNTSYSINIKITRPGSLSPDEVITNGSADITLSVENWETVPEAQIIF